MNNRKVLSLVTVVIAVIVINGCGSRAIVPASYKTYSAGNGAFKITYPAEWEAEGGDKAGYAWVKFSSGSSQITVDANIVGSLMGDIAKSGIKIAGIQNNTEENAPIASVHEQERAGFEEDGSVKEQKAVVIETGFGDSRKSEYTGKTTFGGVFHGYRVTALSNDKRIRVVCQCPEAEWEALKPAFDKVVVSVAQGK
jgi:hypothetical protein